MSITPKHTIIIPHRNRHDHLAACLGALSRAARACDEPDYEVVVIDNGSTLPLWMDHPSLRIIFDKRPMPIFNKCALLNRGIDAAAGETLTFLDADAMVGPEWFRSLDPLQDPAVTKVCHRVRYIGARGCWLRCIDALPAYFADYDSFQRAVECRGLPHTNADEGEPLFGNSQFSIRRNVLGDLRWNERFIGAGHEDFWMNREIHRRHGAGYRAVMDTAPMRCMFHILHPRNAPDWRNGPILTANRNLYYAT